MNGGRWWGGEIRLKYGCATGGEVLFAMGQQVVILEENARQGDIGGGGERVFTNNFSRYYHHTEFTDKLIKRFYQERARAVCVR